MNETTSIFIALYFLVSGIGLPFLWYLHRRKPKLLSKKTTEFDAEIVQAKTDHAAAIDELRSLHGAELEKQDEDFQKRLVRYRGIIDIEEEITRLNERLKKEYKEGVDEKAKLASEKREWEQKIWNTRSDYREKRSVYDKLLAEIAILDDRLSFVELGVYEPHFEFDDSEAFKAEIKSVREEQKAMVSSKTAVFGTKSWTVNGSTRDGEVMIGRAVRLTLRAFNNECEAAIANTRWNNVTAMEKRIARAQAAIDKLNASNDVIISPDYYDLKIRELRLTHEYREKLKQEKDERAELARLEREEKKLIKEAEKAKAEEAKYQALLDKARNEVGAVSAEKHAAKISELERQLADAHEKSERAQAMAEKTKSGFVYIISNVGSFGEDIVKIGLTRRLDPTDRVKELGDASVPFLFDTHAMIYSDEAPKLETALHDRFSDRRVNAANFRKEFFRVSLKEVEDAVKDLAPDADFHSDIEAQEFFETLAKRQELMDRQKEAKGEDLPLEI